MELITIIVPVYNVEKYLEKCIKSIICQTYKNFELILIDDGSNDMSGEICDKYAKLDSRIKVFHTTNKGVSHARNIGLDNASGQYIGFVDSDDFIEPNMYEVLLKKIKEEDSKIIACGYNVVSKKSIIHRTKNSDKKLNCEEAIREIFYGNTIQGFLWNKLFKRSLFLSKRLDENMDICEDLYIVCNLIYEVNSISYVPECLYNYLMRENSATNDIKSMVSDENKLKEFVVLNKLKKDLKNKFDDIIDDYKGTLLMYIYVYFYEDVNKNKFLKNNLRKEIKLNKNNYMKSKYFSKKQKAIYLIVVYFPNVYVKYLNLRKRIKKYIIRRKNEFKKNNHCNSMF